MIMIFTIQVEGITESQNFKPNKSQFLCKLKCGFKCSAPKEIGHYDRCMFACMAEHHCNASSHE